MNEEHSSEQRNYYTDTELAELLGISVGRLHNKLCAGSPLPPRIQPPGCRHRLWPRQAVHDWLERFTVTDSIADELQPRHRGRPTKSEEVARRRHE